MSEEIVVIGVTKVYGRGRVTIPSDLRDMLKIKDGDKVVWYINDRGEICIRKQQERREFREL